MRKEIDKQIISLVKNVYCINEKFSCDVHCIIINAISMYEKKFNIDFTYNNTKSILLIVASLLANGINKYTNLANIDSNFVQMRIIKLVNEAVLQYIRSAYYPHSTMADMFRDMNVNVVEVEDYLDNLNDVLSTSQKFVIRLMCSEGFTVMQVAEMLGVSSQEVRTIHYQASERIRQEWLALHYISSCCDVVHQ